MPVQKIRNLGQVGMVTDVASYDLPMMAFEDARNVRFVDGKIQRAPVHRTIGNLGNSDPTQTYSPNDAIALGKDTMDSSYGGPGGQNIIGGQPTATKLIGEYPLTDGTLTAGLSVGATVTLTTPRKITITCWNTPSTPNTYFRVNGTDYAGNALQSVIKQLPQETGDVVATDEYFKTVTSIEFGDATMGSGSWNFGNCHIGTGDHVEADYQPQHIVNMTEFDSNTTMLIFDNIGRVLRFNNDSVTNVSIPNYNYQPLNGTWTTVKQAGVLYANNSNGTPMFIKKGQTNFQDLTNWVGATTKCKALRGYKDFLLALNVNKAGVEYPTMIKWSDVTPYNTVPATWDETDQTRSSGENILSDTQTEIIDGLTLRDDFIIYCDKSIYKMQFVGSPFIFSFMKIYDDEGIINANCVVEVAGVHFVFGNSDIYMFDGTARKSISAGRVRNKVYERLNKNLISKCFVSHDVTNKQVYFCYNTTNDEVKYPNADSCNEAVVYNYVSDTWSFCDIANAVSGTMSILQKGKTYDDAVTGALSYEDFSGSYMSTEGQRNDALVFLHRPSTDDNITQYKMTALDFIQDGLVAYSIDTEMETTPFVSKANIDMDELTDLEGRKMIRKITPQSFVKNTENGSIYFQFGSHEFPSNSPVYDPSQTFDSSTAYKLDTRMNGRYLSFKLETDKKVDFEISGFDLDVVPQGRR